MRYFLKTTTPGQQVGRQLVIGGSLGDQNPFKWHQYRFNGIRFNVGAAI